MNEKKDSLNKSLVRDLPFLLCDTTGKVEASSFDGQWISSPIQCLGRAIEEMPRIIAVRFGISIQDRETLMDLCTELKRNSFTRECKLLLLLYRKHRKLIEELAQMKADYLRYIDDAQLNQNLMRTIIEGLGLDDRPEAHLILICPFLHYAAIDAQYELSVCGAYLDRMVLGGHRLHKICESPNHRSCEYFSHPRVCS